MEINLRLPEKMDILFQDVVLDTFGNPMIERDANGDILYEVEWKFNADGTEYTEELVIDKDGNPVPRIMRVRNKYILGGRGGGKSQGVGMFAPTDILTNNNTWLLAREIQDSIKKSSYKEFQEGAEELGLQNYFRFLEDSIKCTYNGKMVYFTGLRYISNAIKSIKGIDRAWIEEADTITDGSIDRLRPTVRKPGSQIIWTYNPNHDFDPVHKAAMNPGPRDLVSRINWRDNPWFPEELRYEKDELRRTNFRKYLHVWEGLTQEQSGSTTFDPKWFLNRWKNLKSIRGNCYILFDPANSEHRKSDYTAWCVWILGYDRNKYLIEVGRDRLVGREKWDKLLELHRRMSSMQFNSVTVGWERYGAQSDVSFFKSIMEEVGYRFPIKELGGKMKKTDRISLLSNPMSQGIVYLPVEFENKRKDGIVEDCVKVLIEELSMHPHIPADMHDDVSDVAARIEDPTLGAMFPQSLFDGPDYDEWDRAIAQKPQDRDWTL